MNYLVVFIGCGAGGVARYALTRFASEHVASAIPLGTLAVNLIGSFAIGFLFAAFENRTVPAPVRLLLTTGFLGGFTTFSTYALDTALFFQARDFQAGAANFATHNLLGLAAAAAGMAAFHLIGLGSKGSPPG